MKIITKQEIIDFIKSQPDDRPVNMRQMVSTDSCGCFMVHYGKEVLEIKRPFFCGFQDFFNTHYSLEESIFDIVKYNTIGASEFKTYGEFKKHL